MIAIVYKERDDETRGVDVSEAKGGKPRMDSEGVPNESLARSPHSC
jgi:hypothetical protein